MRKSLIFIIAAAATSSIAADPMGISQHPRVGELCDLHFAAGADTLPIGATPDLDAVAGWAVEHPAGFVVLDSHADTDGVADNKLAIRRADRVRESLVQAHVDRDQVVVALYGPGSHHGIFVWGTDDDGQAIADFTATNGGIILPP
jgi:outer membrane protein OmpA-like peptidoglycan-associated protein